MSRTFHEKMKYTPRCERALLFALELARESGSRWVTTGHLLLGLISLGAGVHYAVLNSFELTEVDFSAANNEKEMAIRTIKTRLDRNARSAVRRGMKEAKRFHHTYLGTEHLLLGILAQDTGPVAELLYSRSVDPALIRENILNELGFSMPNKAEQGKPHPN